MKILISGDSHTAAIKRGKDLLLEKGLLNPTLDMDIRPMGIGLMIPTPFYEDKNEYVLITDETYKKQFTRLPLEEFNSSEIIYGFTSLFHSTRIWRNLDWKKFAPLSLIQNEVMVSEGLINRLIYDDTKYIVGLLDVMQRTRQKIFVIEAPKPFRHHVETLKMRSDIIIDIDKRYRAYIHNELAKRCIPVVSIDRECYDDEGFMLEKYKSDIRNDLHHGNAEYGMLMLQKTLHLLENEFHVQSV